MFKRLFSSGLACIGLAILLSSCGLSITSLFSQGGGAPVAISTNQTTYHAGDAIQGSITNNLQAPVYVYNGLASCSIFILNTQTGGTWSQSNAAPCAQKPSVGVIKINAGQTYNATVKGTLAPGTYRLSLTFSTNPSMSLSDSGRHTNNIHSAAFSFAK